MFNTSPRCNIARDLEGEKKAPAAPSTVSVCASLRNKGTMQLPCHLLTHVAFCLTMFVDNDGSRYNELPRESHSHMGLCSLADL